MHGFAHDAMACTWGIVIPHDDAAYARQAARAAFDEVDRLERELSRFLESSDIARINAAAAGRPVRIGPDAFECLEIAARIHRQTHGAFDVTVGSLVPPRRAAGSAPAPGPPASLRPTVGMARLTLDRATRTVTKTADDLTLDLGAIGKGYAVDRAVEVLRDWKIDAALVHSGQSTIYALGAPLAAAAWPIAVRDPEDHSAILGHVSLRDAALSGSGTRLHGPHIIDPRAGRPADAPAGAWATAPSAAVSDAVSTAFMVLAEEAAAAYCRDHADVGALLCRRGAGGLSLSLLGTMNLSAPAE